MREEHRSRVTTNRLPSLPALHHAFFCWTTLGTSDKSSFWQTRIFHETALRDREDGRATGQPQGVGSEAYLNGTSQEPTPEDGRKDGHIRGRSR